MNLLVLAAGYATRLHPLTQNRSKSLLEVAGRPMIDRVLEAFMPLDPIKKVYIVTNDRYYRDFLVWRAGRPVTALNRRKHVSVLNDETTSDEDKLGAVGDIHFAVKIENLWENDLLVIAGDNLFSQPQGKFLEQALDKPAAIGVYDVGSLDLIKAYSAITLDANGKITAFEEKPCQPKSTVTGISLYYYSRAVLPRLAEYMSGGNNPDQPGCFVEWLHTREDVYGIPIEGQWYDIGSQKTLEEANLAFEGR